MGVKHPSAWRTGLGSGAGNEGPRKAEVVDVGPASVETAVLEAVERESDTDRAGRFAEVEEVEVVDSSQ